jgi:hypothetical protein
MGMDSPRQLSETEGFNLPQLTGPVQMNVWLTVSIRFKWGSQLTSIDVLNQLSNEGSESTFNWRSSINVQLMFSESTFDFEGSESTFQLTLSMNVQLTFWINFRLRGPKSTFQLTLSIIVQLTVSINLNLRIWINFQNDPLNRLQLTVSVDVLNQLSIEGSEINFSIDPLNHLQLTVSINLNWGSWKNQLFNWPSQSPSIEGVFNQLSLLGPTPPTIPCSSENPPT